MSKKRVVLFQPTFNCAETVFPEPLGWRDDNRYRFAAFRDDDALTRVRDTSQKLREVFLGLSHAVLALGHDDLT